MTVPLDLIFEPYTRKFSRMHTIDRLTIEGEGEIREWILLGGYNHRFRFEGICSEVVIGKPCIDGVDVRLEFQSVGIKICLNTVVSTA